MEDRFKKDIEEFLSFDCDGDCGFLDLEDCEINMIIKGLKDILKERKEEILLLRSSE